MIEVDKQRLQNKTLIEIFDALCYAVQLTSYP